MDREVVIKSRGVLLRAVFATFMALIVHLSMIICGNILLTNAIGYDVFVINEESNQQELLYTHYYSESEEDTRLAELNESETEYLKEEIRTKLSPVETAVVSVLSQLFCLGIIISFIYVFVWKIGNKDLNLVKFGRIPFDKYKGLKIGALAGTPFYFMYLLLVLAAIGVLPAKTIIVYRIVYGFAFPLTSAIIGSSFLATELSVIKLIGLALVMLIIPLICHFSYLLGYKDISVKNKIVYKEG